MQRRIYTTNYLLWAIPQSAGIKTGRTEEAGEVLVYEYRDYDKDIVIVIMGSEDRFLDTRTILDWTLESYSWEPPSILSGVLPAKNARESSVSTEIR